MSQDIACLGAAILAGVAGGLFASVEEACTRMVKISRVYELNVENHAVYQRQYEKFKALFQAVAPIYTMDAEPD